MQHTCYIILDKNGVNSVRKSWPRLGPRQIAIRLKITIPNAVFDEFIADATLDVTEESVIKPEIVVEMDTPSVVGEGFEPSASGV